MAVVENPYGDVDPAFDQVEVEQADLVQELPVPGDSVSQLKPSPSQVSKMSGRTYISQL